MSAPSPFSGNTGNNMKGEEATRGLDMSALDGRITLAWRGPRG
jgi:hypothetical protein